MKIKLMTAVLFAVSLNQAFAETATNTFKTEASINNSCLISATSISFGQIMLPLSEQSSSGSMSLLCSNGTPYTVGLAYGGVYGQPAVISTLTNYTIYKLVGSGRVEGVGQLQLPSGQWTTDSAYYSQAGVSQINGVTNISQLGYTATKLNIKDSTVVNGTACRFAAFGCNVYTTTQASTTYRPLGDRGNSPFGIMTGVIKGDTIAYSIYLPNDSSQVWNTGQAVYSDVGTGVFQNINMRASIRSGWSSSLYPIPDTYMDTVTATISY